MRSSYISEKNQPHFLPEQWQLRHRSTEGMSEVCQSISENVRNLADKYRNSVANVTKWKFQETNNCFKERISDVDQRYRFLERVLAELKNQVQRLSEAKMAAEKTFHDILPLQQTVREVMNYRDQRKGIELVEDVAYRQLRLELRLIDSARNNIKDICHYAWEQLLELKDQRDKLAYDLKEKEKSLQIDEYKATLTPQSTDRISYKPLSFELPDHTVSLETWIKTFNEKLNQAQLSIQKAMQSTIDIWENLRTHLSDINQQREITQRALRKRIHDISNVRDNLVAQKELIQDEIEKLQKKIPETEKAIADTAPYIKLAETRLENRRFRPGFECVSDHLDKAIRDEHKSARQARDLLIENLKDIKNQLNCIQYHLHEIEDDLERTEKTLEIEKACLEIHSRPPRAAYQGNIAFVAPAKTSNYACQFSSNERVEEPVEENFCECTSRQDDAVAITERGEADEYALVD